MLEWIVDKIMAAVNAVPALLVDETSPNFMLGRTLIGLALIVIVVYLIAMRPFRSAVSRCIGRIAHLFDRSA
jgi:hypothetical protein